MENNFSEMTAEFFIQHQNLSEEARQSLWLEQNKPADAPASDAPTGDNPSPNEPAPASDAPSADAPQPDAPSSDKPADVPTFDFSKFGVSSAEELESKLKEYEGGYKKYKEVEKDLNVLEQVKNPFANEKIMQMNQFIKATGIQNESIALEVMATNAEGLQKDPLKAVVIQEILNNPALASLSMNDIRAYVANKNGVDLELYGTEGYDNPINLKVDSIKAIQQIEEKRKEFANINNYFVDLQTELDNQTRLLAENREKWNVATPQLSKEVKSIDVVVKTGLESLKDDISFTVAVSESEVQQAVQQIKPFFERSELNNESTAQFKQAVLDTLRLAKQPELIAEAVRRAEGKIREQIVKEKHNLAPVTEKTQEEPRAKVLSEAEQEFQRLSARR